jgi:Putative prokaryotic signal transducing protein
MNRTRLRSTIRLLWTAAAVGLIGVLISGLGTGVRLWLLTALAVLAAPSSFVIAPAANWLIGRLDLENSRSIDVCVSTTIAAFGYIQWFVLPVIYKRTRGQARSLSRSDHYEDRGTGGHNEQSVGAASLAVFYGDDPECLSLKMLLEGSGINASLRSYSMSGGGVGRTDVRVFVEREDLDRARPLVEHFQEQLRNSPKR